MDCRSEISRKMRTWQYPILLSYLYLINYYLMPFWTFVNVCFWPFKMGCRTCRECKSLCQFIKFMPLMPLAFVSGRSGRKAHKRSDPHNCKCRLDILPGTFVNVLRALVFKTRWSLSRVASAVMSRYFSGKNPTKTNKTLLIVWGAREQIKCS